VQVRVLPVVHVREELDQEVVHGCHAACMEWIISSSPSTLFLCK
jgi:hypothetical protein